MTMLFLKTVFLVVGAFGHAMFWIGLLNRIHAFGCRRWLIESVSAPCRVALVVMPCFVAVDYASSNAWFFEWDHAPAQVYVAAMAVLAIREITATAIDWRRRRMQVRIFISNHSSDLDLAKLLGFRPAGDRLTSFLGCLPGNEIFHLRTQYKELRLPKLETGLDGLRIAQISDLHMSGRIDKPYFEEVIRLTNETRPDLTLITGDLFDSEQCLDWIPDTYARLEAKEGVYFIFGNHDRRIDCPLARRLLVESGMKDLGDRWELLNIRGCPVLLAGNERPWFKSAADMDIYEDDANGPAAFRILLSHTPDQIQWARDRRFDLMLAGHTHGGQFTIPGLGPIIAPSQMGTKYASGVFYEDPTVLHVTRGVSSYTPLRWNCPPELSVLVLRA